MQINQSKSVAYSEQRLNVTNTEVSTSDKMPSTPSATAREETEAAESPSTSNNLETRQARGQIQAKRFLAERRMLKKIIKDDITPPSFVVNQTQTSTSRRIMENERGAVNMLHIQEDSQASQAGMLEGRVRLYETEMQKRMKEFVNYVRSLITQSFVS
ncbi:unnamed protein product [Thelazia callipaeda]|uniref:Uncharacterized protein n=1 Tax=Thelazia callipaeda TaxID=103827 RepID=A0A0N5CQS3_THECL|nr:unnamed protein product [Thelazia callipaeda]